MSETGWLVWVEADTHNLRVAVPTRSARTASRVPCMPGYYMSSQTKQCTACNGTSWLPYVDVGYINEGAIDGGGTCRCVLSPTPFTHSLNVL